MNSTFIVDTSVIIKWLNTVNEENVDEATKILEKGIDGSIKLYTPELAKYEVGNVLLYKKGLTVKEAKVSLLALHTLPLIFAHETLELAETTFTLAYKHSITYYDASFLALAKSYDATLITENVKHHGKAKNIVVLPLKDYFRH